MYAVLVILLKIVTKTVKCTPFQAFYLPLTVQKPQLACFVAQHEQNAHTTDEYQEDCQQQEYFNDNFYELMNSTRNQGKKTQDEENLEGNIFR